MSIQILPPQLANQIAAGEVVERPASVVKELVENSLDAAATCINIDIERGGTKMIRIRDNGYGIHKKELTLALARHATSKIACLDDLECITSMGFRGEALASISSVSRLILTSRPAEQREAWQAYAEGRNTKVTLNPVAHPVGSTVEVLDLFYNTPARRKFMCTEKTEFGHIDKIIRSIALAHFNITFILQHNGKIVRQYRAVNQKNQHIQRLKRLCGPMFIKRALAISWQHDNLSINGWIADPDGKDLPEMQYSYVNLRIIRDKLINHAIRQAYQEQMTGTQQPAFILFLNVDPHQIDINVHPSKHTVRFHQARLVHDFIYQAIITVLQQNAAPMQPINESKANHRALKNQQSSNYNHFLRQTSGAFSVADPQTHKGCFTDNAETRCSNDYFESSEYQNKEPDTYWPLIESHLSQFTTTEKHNILIAGPKKNDWPFTNDVPISPKYLTGLSNAGSANKAIEGEKNMLTSLVPFPNGGTIFAVSAQPASSTRAVSLKTETSYTGILHSFGRLLTICPPCYALLESAERLTLLSLPVAERYLTEQQLIPDGDTLRAQPLLIPVRMMLGHNETTALKKHQNLLEKMGITLQVHQHQTILSAVPLPLRGKNLQKLIPDLLNYLYHMDVIMCHQVATWLAKKLSCKTNAWSYSRAIELLSEIEQTCLKGVQNPPDNLLITLNLEAAIKALNHG